MSRPYGQTTSTLCSSWCLRSFSNFFIDLAGHIEDEPLSEALRALWLRTENLRFIGSWPAADQSGPKLDTTEFDKATAWVAKVRAGR